MGSGDIKRTVLHDWHVSAGAKMLEFGGFDMPIQYQATFAEHIATRSHAGLFDISHMGRFSLSGRDAVSGRENRHGTSGASL